MIELCINIYLVSLIATSSLRRTGQLLCSKVCRWYLFSKHIQLFTIFYYIFVTIVFRASLMFMVGFVAGHYYFEKHFYVMGLIIKGDQAFGQISWRGSLQTV